MARLIVPATVEGPVIACTEGLSFWGGVDTATGTIADPHHPQHGETLVGRVVLMPTSRGSCTGSGVLLELALNGRAPAALAFREDEEILTLGAIIARTMFDCSIAVLRLSAEEYDNLARSSSVRISESGIAYDGAAIALEPLEVSDLSLSDRDRSMLAGDGGPAVRIAMETLVTMAALQGAKRMIDISRVHIDGCIYASPANLRFAARMAEMGAQVRVPTTMNAISVDYDNWQQQQVPADFGRPASDLADAYVRMGARPSFTCAPYQLENPPAAGEDIGWSESNAVIYANSVLGARTAKHADFLDLCIGLTGRVPEAGVYLTEHRRARREVVVEVPDGHDDAFWPLLGWVIGQAAPDRIPRLLGLEGTSPSEDDLRALAAAFGTTSAAPMFHIAGVTPEGNLPVADGADRVRIGRAELARAWSLLNTGGEHIDLVSLGSPHFSLSETRKFSDLLNRDHCHDSVAVIITLGRGVLAAARSEGLVSRLEDAGVRIIPDLCWCSISEPVFPPDARVLMTNSGKYAHYAPALCGREVRFGSLAECARAAVQGRAVRRMPGWLS